MARRSAYVEVGLGGDADRSVGAWSFDLDSWGECGFGPTEESALSALEVIAGEPIATVTERIRGDELAFDRDHEPASLAERKQTEVILRLARAETIDLIGSSSAAELDWDDPDRHLPEWAWWRTLRQMAWHIIFTESNYYLAALNVATRTFTDDLLGELTTSLDQVLEHIYSLPADAACTSSRGTWTTVKMLRRLAWHERSELLVMRQLQERAREAGRTR